MNFKNQLVPPQPLGARRCSNCACYYSIPEPANPLQSQGFCAKEPPVSSMVRLELPQLDKEGHPVMSRLDPKKPATRTEEGIGFAHKPTAADLVCFDGWRPLSAQPGERFPDVRQRERLAALVPVLTQAAINAGLHQEFIAMVAEALKEPQTAAAQPLDS